MPNLLRQRTPMRTACLFLNHIYYHLGGVWPELPWYLYDPLCQFHYRYLALNSYNYVSRILFLSRFSFNGTDDSQDSKEREGTGFYSTLSLPPEHKHSEICNFACEINVLTYFLPQYLCLPDCYSMRCTTLSN